MDFLIQTGIMFLGSLFPLWLRAVKKTWGSNTWDLFTFIIQNRVRFVLCFVGVLLVSTILSVDAVGIREIFSSLGWKIGGNAFSGFAVSSFVLLKEKAE